MSDSLNLVAFAASLRDASFNRKLIGVASTVAREAGANVTLLDLGDYALPVYDANLEAKSGLPENAHRLKQVFAVADAFLFSLPEYNGSVTPLFKNTIDWASRPVDGKPGLGWATNKPAGLLSASNGALGGLRGLYHARWVLQTIGMIALPQQKALARAASAFDADGQLIDPKEYDAVKSVVVALVDITRRLSA